jgi:hypothetical protein
MEPFGKDVLDHRHNVESNHHFWPKVIRLTHIMANRKTEPHRCLPYSDRPGNDEIEGESPLRLFPIVNQGWIGPHRPAPAKEEDRHGLYRRGTGARVGPAGYVPLTYRHISIFGTGKTSFY